MDDVTRCATRPSLALSLSISLSLSLREFRGRLAEGAFILTGAWPCKAHFTRPSTFHQHLSLWGLWGVGLLWPTMIPPPLALSSNAAYCVCRKLCIAYSKKLVSLESVAITVSCHLARRFTLKRRIMSRIVLSPHLTLSQRASGGGLVLINESENRRKGRQALPSDKDGPGYVPHDDFQQIPTNFLTLEQLVDSEPQFPKPFSFHRKPSFPSEAQPQEIKGSLWFTEMAPGTG